MHTLAPLKGRWQRLSSAPTVLCDIAHNAAALAVTMRQICRLHTARLRVVFGLSSIERVSEALWSSLPHTAYYFFAQACVLKSVPAQYLHKEAVRRGLRGEVVTHVNEAISAAKFVSSSDDLIYVCGSAYMLAEVEGL